MSCGLYRSGFIELARDGRGNPKLSLHLENCAKCQEFLAAQRRLSVAARGVAATAAVSQLPAGLERQLLAEFDAVRRVPARLRTFWFTAGAFALTVAAIMAVVLLRVPKPAPPSQPAIAVVPIPVPPTLTRPVTVPPRPVHARGMVPAKQPEAQEARFVSIPYTMPLAANERADVIRMDVPVAALIAAGLPLRVQDMGASASADVLVGEDGRARAVRLISVADSGSAYSGSTRSFR